MGRDRGMSGCQKRACWQASRQTGTRKAHDGWKAGETGVTEKKGSEWISADRRDAGFDRGAGQQQPENRGQSGFLPIGAMPASIAAQATHALIVDPAAAAERGRNILSDRGAQEDVELSVPLFPQPLAAGTIGRVLPLELVEVQAAAGNWQALCTAARWDVRRTGDALVVEQALTLERHYEN